MIRVHLIGFDIALDGRNENVEILSLCGRRIVSFSKAGPSKLLSFLLGSAETVMSLHEYRSPSLHRVTNNFTSQANRLVIGALE